MPGSPTRASYALVVDATADPRAAASALDRAADTGRGRVVLICCDAAIARKIRRYVTRGHATVTVHTRSEAAAVVKGLRPLRIGFQLEEPLAFSALLVDRSLLVAAA